MGKIRKHPPVKLISGFIISETKIIDEVEQKMIDEFGDIDFQSELMPFDYTDYYKPEMGKNLMRRFVSFESLIHPEDIASIKLFTNELETEFFFPDTTNRMINIDPGYITAAKLLLVTTKDHAHRIYLRNGIFAEVTLRYHNNSFVPWEWTYPDYKTENYITIFNQIRNIYMRQLKKQGYSAHPIIVET